MDCVPYTRDESGQMFHVHVLCVPYVLTASLDFIFGDVKTADL